MKVYDKPDFVTISDAKALTFKVGNNNFTTSTIVELDMQHKGNSGYTIRVKTLNEVYELRNVKQDNYTTTLKIARQLGLVKY